MNPQNNQEERKFIITENLATAVLQYLAKRPYEEVFPLIAGLQRLDLFQAPALDKDKNKDSENRVE